jgi:hypothetical protein
VTTRDEVRREREELRRVRRRVREADRLLAPARHLGSDALLFLRMLVAAGPLGRTRAARAARLDRERFTCHSEALPRHESDGPATPRWCRWGGCPLGPGDVAAPAGRCFLIGAP